MLELVLFANPGGRKRRGKARRRRNARRSPSTAYSAVRLRALYRAIAWAGRRGRSGVVHRRTGKAGSATAIAALLKRVRRKTTPKRRSRGRRR